MENMLLNTKLSVILEAQHTYSHYIVNKIYAILIYIYLSKYLRYYNYRILKLKTNLL